MDSLLGCSFTQKTFEGKKQAVVAAGRPKSVERSFSSLKRIKSFSQNKMEQDRLSDLGLISIQGRRQLREIGGAKLKSGGKGFRRIFLAEITGDLPKKKKSSPKSKGFFWPKSQILTFFPPNNSNFFLPKKFRGGGKKKIGGAKTKIGGQKRKSGGHCPPAPRLYPSSHNY